MVLIDSFCTVTSYPCWKRRLFVNLISCFHYFYVVCPDFWNDEKSDEMFVRGVSRPISNFHSAILNSTLSISCKKILDRSSIFNRYFNLIVFSWSYWVLKVANLAIIVHLTRDVFLTINAEIEH